MNVRHAFGARHRRIRKKHGALGPLEKPRGERSETANWSVLEEREWSGEESTREVEEKGGHQTRGKEASQQEEREKQGNIRKGLLVEKVGILQGFVYIPSTRGKGTWEPHYLTVDSNGRHCMLSHYQHDYFADDTRLLLLNDSCKITRTGLIHDEKSNQTLWKCKLETPNHTIVFAALSEEESRQWALCFKRAIKNTSANGRGETRFTASDESFPKLQTQISPTPLRSFDSHFFYESYQSPERNASLKRQGKEAVKRDLHASALAFIPVVVGSSLEWKLFRKDQPDYCARQIQAFWRAQEPRREKERLLVEKRLERRRQDVSRVLSVIALAPNYCSKKALRIQSVYRGFRSRKIVRKNRAHLFLVQQRFRELQLRKQKAVLTVQRFWRACLTSKHLRVVKDCAEAFCNVRVLSLVASRRQAAQCIQRNWRGFVIVRSFRKVLRRVVKLQHWWRHMRDRMLLRRLMNDNVSKVQRFWRKRKAAQKVGRRKKVLQRVLQTVFRFTIWFHHVRKARASTIISTRWRRKTAAQLFLAKRRAYVRIQAWARSVLLRKRYLALKIAQTIVAKAVRGWILREKFQRIRVSAVKIQRFARGYVRCFVYVRKMMVQHTNATKIQRWVKQIWTMRIMRAHIRAVKIQTWWRTMTRKHWFHCISSKVKLGLCRFQACIRGWIVRQPRGTRAEILAFKESLSMAFREHVGKILGRACFIANSLEGSREHVFLTIRARVTRTGSPCLEVSKYVGSVDKYFVSTLIPLEALFKFSWRIGLIARKPTSSVPNLAAAFGREIHVGIVRGESHAFRQSEALVVGVSFVQKIFAQAFVTSSQRQSRVPERMHEEVMLAVQQNNADWAQDPLMKLVRTLLPKTVHGSYMQQFLSTRPPLSGSLITLLHAQRDLFSIKHAGMSDPLDISSRSLQEQYEKVSLLGARVEEEIQSLSSVFAVIDRQLEVSLSLLGSCGEKCADAGKKTASKIENGETALERMDESTRVKELCMERAAAKRDLLNKDQIWSPVDVAEDELHQVELHRLDVSRMLLQADIASLKRVIDSEQVWKSRIESDFKRCHMLRLSCQRSCRWLVSVGRWIQTHVQTKLQRFLELAHYILETRQAMIDLEVARVTAATFGIVKSVQRDAIPLGVLSAQAALRTLDEYHHIACGQLAEEWGTFDLRGVRDLIEKWKHCTFEIQQSTGMFAEDVLARIQEYHLSKHEVQGKRLEDLEPFQELVLDAAQRRAEKLVELSSLRSNARSFWWSRFVGKYVSVRFLLEERERVRRCIQAARVSSPSSCSSGSFEGSSFSFSGGTGDTDGEEDNGQLFETLMAEKRERERGQATKVKDKLTASSAQQRTKRGMLSSIQGAKERILDVFSSRKQKAALLIQRHARGFLARLLFHKQREEIFLAAVGHNAATTIAMFFKYVYFVLTE